MRLTPLPPDRVEASRLALGYDTLGVSQEHVGYMLLKEQKVGRHGKHLNT